MLDLTEVPAAGSGCLAALQKPPGVWVQGPGNLLRASRSL